MKTRTKVMIATIVMLVGVLLLINHLFDKKEIDIHQEDYLRASAISEFFEEYGDKSMFEEQTTTQTTTTKVNTTTTTKKAEKVLKTTTTSTYKITHYGADCKKCSGITASGYNVKNTIYYDDATYGTLRIVAIKGLSLYSVIKIKNYKFGGDITAIVLDRGVGSGVIDLLVNGEKEAATFGIQKNVNIEILRNGR